MRFFEILTFSFFCVFLMPVTTYVQSCETSKLKPVVERVFSRKKRFVILPKGSYLKFTGSLSKHLLSKYPRGFSFTVEAAIYYPVPGNRNDIYPKRLRKPTTTMTKPTDATKPTLIYIPGTNWRFKAKPIPKPNSVELHRIDKEPTYWSDEGPSAYTNPVNWAQWSKYGQKYSNWTSNKMYDMHPRQQSKWAKWTSSPKWSDYGKKWNKYNQRWRRQLRETEEDVYEKFREERHEQDPTLSPHQPFDYPELDDLLKWRHYHGHRDRRQLFDHFTGLSNIFGIDIKHCILRAICESKSLLLPQGYSMLQDVIRVLFTMPTISGLEDDYSRMMRLDAEECIVAVTDKCNFSILGWLLSRNSEW